MPNNTLNHDSQLEIEKQKLEIEREKLELEKERIKRDYNVFNKYFGVIITAILTVAVIAVSDLQVWIATIQKDKELEIQKNESDRQWRIAATNCVSKRYSGRITVIIK